MSLNLDKSTWKRVAFGDVIENVTDRVDDPSKAGVDRYVGLEHLDPGVMSVERWGTPDEVEAQKLRFEPGDVIFGRRRAYQKKVALAEFEGICSAHALVLRGHPDCLDPDFLPVFLSSGYFLDRAISISVGSLSPTVNWRDLRVQEFDLPPLDAQTRIADLLWAVERCARGNAAVQGAVRNACDAWLERAVESGVSERGWPERMVSELVVAGPTNGKSATANDERRGIPTLSISAIRDGRVLGGSSVKYIDVDPEDVAGFVIAPDDFLVVRGNGNKQLTGLGGLADAELPEGCIYPDLLIRLRFDSKVILPAFAAAQWNCRPVHRALIRKAKSTNGIWKINGKDIRSHRLTVPPLHDQFRVLQELSGHTSTLEVERSEAASLKAVRSSILSDVFGGI